MSNRKTAAADFLRRVASGDVRAAYAQYVTANFRHHNPYFKGDAQSLMLAMEENAKQNPGKNLEVLRLIEEGDLVAVHSRVRHNEKEAGFALVHIFRFEGDRVAELWDLAQEIPASSPNEYGMF